MNFIHLLLGAAAVRQFTDYPPEIRQLKSQLPKEEREAVLRQYKGLPGQAKNDFKAALKSADLAAASQILGQDLTKYNIAIGKNEAPKTEVAMAAAQPEQPVPLSNSDFAARIEKILAVPTSIDPELVAEAAKRYEAAVPLAGGENISEKTKKLLELKA